MRLTERRRDADGSVDLAWEQQVGGVPNVDGGLQASVDGDGRLINVRGGPLPDPQGARPASRITARRGVRGGDPRRDVRAPGRHPARRRAAHAVPRRRPGLARAVPRRRRRPARLAHPRRGRLRRVLRRDRRRPHRPAPAPREPHALRRPGHPLRREPPRRRATAATLSAMEDHWLSRTDRLQGPYVHAVSDLSDHLKPTVGPNGPVAPTPLAADEVAPTSAETWNYSPMIGPPVLQQLLLGRPGRRAAGRAHPEPRVQHRPAVLVRQHVPRPSRRGADRLHRSRRVQGRRRRPRAGARRLDGRPGRPAHLEREHDRAAGRVPRPDADVPVPEHERRPLRRRHGRRDRLPRVHPRPHRAAGQGRAGVRRADRPAARRHRRGDERLLRDGLPRRDGADRDRRDRQPGRPAAGALDASEREPARPDRVPDRGPGLRRPARS